MADSLRPRSKAVDETRPLLGEGGTVSTPHHDEAREAPVDIKPPHAVARSWRISATMLSFAVLGMFNSPIGVIIPPLEQYYHLTDVQVSLIFLAPAIGYVIATQLSRRTHLELGQRGIAVIGPLLHLLYAAAAAAHPPFVVLLLAVAAGSVGTGMLDASWCAWAAGLDHANTISGLLHGSYSAGAAAGPFIASLIIAAGHRPWYHWYYVLMLASLVELFILIAAFRHQDAAKYREDKQHASVDDDDFFAHAKDCLGRRVTWISAIYLLIYVGTEVAVSSWIVVYMTRTRHTSPFMASLCSSGFWVGMALGRMALGYPTDRIGVRRAAMTYIVCAMIFEILFIGIKVPAVSVGLMALLGFFCGPLFPSCIVRMNQLLPRTLHVSAVSFVSTAGQIGGAVFPFALGALAQHVGIHVFPFFELALLAGALGIWCLFSSLPLPSVDASVDASVDVLSVEVGEEDEESS